MMSKERVASFGPCTIPNTGPLDKLRLSREQLMNAWRLVGPSASRNIEKLPLWKVIVCAYVEGLHHGAEVTKEKMIPEQSSKRVYRDAI